MFLSFLKPHAMLKAVYC